MTFEIPPTTQLFFFSKRSRSSFLKRCSAALCGIGLLAQSAVAQQGLPNSEFFMVDMTCEVTGQSFNIHEFEKGYRLETENAWMSDTVKLIIENSDFKGKNGMKPFSLKDPIAFWVINEKNNEKIFAHISGWYSDDLESYPDLIFVGDKEGSSVALRKTGEQIWTGRAISTQGVVDGNAFDFTIYLALKCSTDGGESAK